ncbi:hypothetical protein JTB14_003426 [Gonioctena quinquepunctata]|nr:hypothetical protein JTB14_003426 [Gonioctena quinquepunctata]
MQTLMEKADIKFTKGVVTYDTRIQSKGLLSFIARVQLKLRVLIQRPDNVDEYGGNALSSPRSCFFPSDGNVRGYDKGAIFKHGCLSTRLRWLL